MWRRTAPAIRAAYLAGMGLLVSGIAHGVTFLRIEAEWDGVVSLRKPMLFGVSFGITLLTLTWVATRLTITTRWRNRLLVALAAASVVEVGLITLQFWRGQPSHFNVASGFDNTVFVLMGVAVSMVAVVIAILALAAIRPVEARPSLVSAVRGGLALGVIAQLTGGLMLAIGFDAPDPVEASAAARHLALAHALPLHALQVLPILAMIIGRITDEPRALRAVRALTIAYAVVVAVTIISALGG